MKVYVATSGEYSDYRVQHIFANREDAEAYAGADEVTEWDVLDHPVEQRQWYQLIWSPKIEDREHVPGYRMGNPHEQTWQEDYTGNDPGYAAHHWTARGSEVVLCVQGWELDRVRKVYSEQRAQYLADQER
jgi:hypothetical protein